MKKYLKSDDEVKTLETKEALWEYLNFRKEHDEWLNVYINEMGAIGVKNEPLFIPQYCTKLKVKKNGYTIDVPDIDYQTTENEECIQDTGLFLVLPYKNRISCFPTRRIAYPTICKRADDDCGTMYRFDPRPSKQVLPIDEKAERLSRDYLLYSDNCKILYRDGKISAALSKEYAILPADELVGALEAQLKTDHPEYKFDRGSVDHEYLVAEYLLNDQEMEETFRLTLNDAGADFSELRAGVRFSTSDVGLSKVYATLFYDADGVRTTLGSGVELEHKGENSVEMFAVQCEKLGMLFKESEERIEQLGNMEIQNVSGTVHKIREMYPFFPKTISEEVEEELRIRYPNGGTGIDVYLALNDIVQRHAKQMNLSPTRYLNLSESVAKLMGLPFDHIDKGEDN